MTHKLSSLYLSRERKASGVRALSLRGYSGLFGAVLLASLMLLASALLVGPAQAQKKVAPSLQIDKALSGKLLYWLVTGPSSASEPVALKYQPGAPAPLALTAGTQNTTQLYVLDVTTGKVAHLTWNTRGATPLRPEDFMYAQSLQIPVTYKGRPALGLLVALQYKGEDGKIMHKSYWLQPSEGGVAHFADVPLGKSLTVQISDGVHSPLSVTGTAFQMKTDSPFAFSEIAVPTNWDVQNTEPLSSAPTTSISAPAASLPTVPSDTNVLSIVVSVVVGILVLAVLLFWLIDTGRLKPLMPVPASAGYAPPPIPQSNNYRPAPIPTDTAPAAGPRLVATLGAYAGSIFPLMDSSTEIGRDIANTVALTQDSAASRRHAHIQTNNGQYILVDDGSSNGTYVNGIRIASQSPKPLRPGDEVQIGTTRFRFEA